MESPGDTPTFTLILAVVDAEGRPVEGAVASVIHNNTVASCCGWPFHGKELRSDAAGHLEIPGLDAELAYGWRYFVSLSHPDRVEGMLDRPEHLPRTSGIARARIALPEGHTIEGVLRGGRASAGKITVSLDDPIIPGCHSVTRFAVIDADGAFRVTGLHPGPHCLIAHAPGAASVIRAVQIPCDEPIAIELPEARRASGRVLGEDGAPFAGGLLTAHWPGAYGYRELTTDAEGRFSFDALPLGCRIEIAAFVGDPEREGVGFSILEPEGGDVDLTFDARERGRLGGGMYDDRTGAPGEGDTSVAALVRGTEITFHAHRDGAGGAFTIPLPAGEYTLACKVWGPEDIVASALVPSVSVAPGEVREDVRVELAAAFRVLLRVVDAATGAPVAGAGVSASPPGVWARVYLGNTDAEGIYAVEPAIEAPLRAQVEAEGYARSRTGTIDVKRGMEPVVVKLERSPKALPS